MNRSRRVWIVATLLVVGIFAVINSDRGLAPPTQAPRWIAHRAVHQPFRTEGLTGRTCTAERIVPPRHGFMENTIPAIALAFGSGAEVVEIDLHPTTDGTFAVFHDWTLECRTNGSGRVRDHSMAELKTLDIGWGYTADDGHTFPLRGSGVGLMPSLPEVVEAFPGRRFLLDFKSNDAAEAAPSPKKASEDFLSA